MIQDKDTFDINKKTAPFWDSEKSQIRCNSVDRRLSGSGLLVTDLAWCQKRWLMLGVWRSPVPRSHWLLVDLGVSSAKTDDSSKLGTGCAMLPPKQTGGSWIWVSMLILWVGDGLGIQHARAGSCPMQAAQQISPCRSGCSSGAGAAGAAGLSVQRACGDPTVRGPSESSLKSIEILWTYGPWRGWFRFWSLLSSNDLLPSREFPSKSSQEIPMKWPAGEVLLPSHKGRFTVPFGLSCWDVVSSAADHGNCSLFASPMVNS